MKSNQNENLSPKCINDQQNLKSNCYVLGNGSSRASISLELLQRTGTVIGCNALYRDITPDHLVAVDRKMICELDNAKYIESNTVWTSFRNKHLNIPHLNYLPGSYGWSSGPYALYLASHLGYREIYIIGFDYQGTQGKFNNIYADTHNYKKSSDTQTYWGNWVQQTKTVISMFPDVKYKRVIEHNALLPKEFDNLSNLCSITIPHLVKMAQKHPI